MSSDLFVQSIARKKLKIKRRRHVSGEVMICFRDPSISPINIVDNQVIELTALRGVTTYAIQRSNLRTLIGMGYIEVVI